MATAVTPRGITDLPVELIHHVCSFLTLACVVKDIPYPCRDCLNRRPGCRRWFRGQLHISRLSRTCKALRDAVLPLVFQCCPDAGPWAVRRLILLARTLVARPDLRQHVRFVMLRERNEDIRPEDDQFVKDSIVQLSLPAVPDYWNTDGEPHHRLLPLELLLAYTPNLEYLHMPLDYNWDLHLLPQLAKTHPPLLPALKSLEVSHYFIAGDRFDISMHAVEAIAAHAPNLEAMCLPDPAFSYGGTFAPLPSLRKLYWQAPCAANPDALAAMLAAAPRLEVLALPWDALDDGYNCCEDRCTTDAWKVVECRRDSLRELRLDIRDDTPQGTGEDSERDALTDFEKLEVLMVDGHALGSLRAVWKRRNKRAKVDSFLSTMFPASIREVTFWRPDGVELQAAMLRFAKVVSVGRYPNLKSVVLAPSQKSERYDDWHNADEWNGVKGELEELFGKGGVTFELSWDNPYWKANRLD